MPAFPELSGKEWKIDTDQGETGAGSSVQKKPELSKPSRDADCPSGRICFIHFSYKNYVKTALLARFNQQS